MQIEDENEGFFNFSTHLINLEQEMESPRGGSNMAETLPDILAYPVTRAYSNHSPFIYELKM